jgi:hypothetical protein
LHLILREPISPPVRVRSGRLAANSNIFLFWELHGYSARYIIGQPPGVKRREAPGGDSSLEAIQALEPFIGEPA